MTADDEIVFYLGLLIEHRDFCVSDGCSSCLALQNIIAVIKRRIFSGPIDEELMLSRRLSSRSKGLPAASHPSPTLRKCAVVPPEDLDQAWLQS